MKTAAIVAGLFAVLIAFLSFVLRPKPSAPRVESAKLVFKGDASGFSGGERVFYQGVLVGQTSAPVIEGKFAVMRLSFNKSAPHGLPACTEFDVDGHSLKGHPKAGSDTVCKPNLFAVSGQSEVVDEYWRSR